MKKINLYFLALVVLIMASCAGGSGQQEESTQTESEATTVAEEKKPEYPELLQKVFEAHGGLETWQAQGTLEYDLYKNEELTGGEHQLIDLTNRKVLLSAEAYKIGFDGEEVWVSPNKAAFGSSPRFYHNLFFYFFAIPFVFGDEGINYEVIGETTVAGKTYNAIKVSFNAGVGDAPDDYYIGHFNVDTNQLELLLYTVTYRSREKTENYNALVYEWQEANGLIIPKSITGYKYSEGELGDQRYKGIFENVTFKTEQPDQSVFAIPAESEIDTLITELAQ
ncbi:MAG: hypothetical protein AAFX87_22350 [Bacteroidota bacterium]